MRTRFLLAAITAALVSTSPAFAWGKLGHRVTGEIAQRHLSPAARAGVHLILGAEDLAEASTWPDEMRSDPSTFWQKTANPWHYVTVAPGTHYGPASVPPEGDAATALARFEAVLRDPKAARADKQLALRFAVHIIGDLHQPLHAGNGTDKGGNDVRVTWFGRGTNLHSVWDSNIIDEVGLSYTEYARWLDRRVAPLGPKGAGETDPHVWIEESAKLRDGVYPAEPALSFVYAHEQLPLAEQRLTLAGYRLAAWLNRLFAPAQR